jgi:hypothetical protein
MDPHRPVRGGEEREAGDGGPRDVLAVVLAPARSRVQNLRGKGRRIQGREGEVRFNNDGAEKTVKGFPWFGVVRVGDTTSVG